MKLRLFCLFVFVSVIAASHSSADEIGYIRVSQMA